MKINWFLPPTGIPWDKPMELGKRSTCLTRLARHRIVHNIEADLHLRAWEGGRCYGAHQCYSGTLLMEADFYIQMIHSRVAPLKIKLTADVICSARPWTTCISDLRKRGTLLGAFVSLSSWLAFRLVFTSSLSDRPRQALNITSAIIFRLTGPAISPD